MEDISTRMSALDFAESHVHKAMNSASLQGNNNSNSTYSAIVPLQQVFNLQTTKYQSSYGNWKSSRSSRGTYNVGDRSFQVSVTFSAPACWLGSCTKKLDVAVKLLLDIVWCGQDRHLFVSCVVIFCRLTLFTKEH